MDSRIVWPDEVSPGDIILARCTKHGPFCPLGVDHAEPFTHELVVTSIRDYEKCYAVLAMAENGEIVCYQLGSSNNPIRIVCPAEVP